MSDALHTYNALEKSTQTIPWKNIYFIGIGGIGMSALARYFKALGKQVAGYDKTKTTLTATLEELEIIVNDVDAIQVIPELFLDPKDTLVVYTPAISNTNKQWIYFKQHSFKILKRSEALGLITNQSFCFAVAGTHGKTTTTSILAHLLYANKLPLTGFLGGISENYDSNLLLRGTAISVVEADEFDRSFLTLAPNIACITSMDADHLDIYGDKESLTDSFVAFSKRLKENGVLLVKKGLPLKGITYSINEDADYQITNLNIINGSYLFDIKTPNEVVSKVTFKLPGKHNLLNALVAFAMADLYGVPVEKLKKALQTYKGVKRRFTYHIKTEGQVYIDDYAHHPTEINAVYQAVTEMYPNTPVMAVFQPHLFSRTRDFIDEFAASLSQFDKVVLLDIYPAREQPISGVNSQVLLDKIATPFKQLASKEELLSIINKHKEKIVITMGAGDIGVEVSAIKKELLACK